MLIPPLTYQAFNSFHITWRFVHVEYINTIVVLSIIVVIFVIATIYIVPPLLGLDKTVIFDLRLDQDTHGRSGRPDIGNSLPLVTF